MKVNPQIPTPDCSQGVNRAIEIDAACVRFENEWNSGGAPRIEEYLDAFAPHFRSELLRELLAAENGLRKCHSQPPLELDGCLARFATFSEIVREALSDNGEDESRGEYQSARALPHDRHLPCFFGQYELLDEIASGGMGVVYRARQLGLNRIVALKMIRTGEFATADERLRFQAEAKAAAQLQHPHIVPIHEVGEHEGHLYYSMDFIGGESLAKRVTAGPLHPREAAQVMRTISETVAYAHGQGILHRDLAPGNVLLDRMGVPWVTDFGLARQIADDSNLTRTGQVIGTPSYMPPEQARGSHREIGVAADVYSLGAVLYFVLTGRPPFQAATAFETVSQVLNSDPVTPRRMNSMVDRDLDTICMKCLEKSPAARYASAGAVAEELGRYLSGEPIKARRTGAVRRVARWCRRKPLLASFVLVCSAALIATAVFQIQLAATRQSAEIYRYFTHLGKVRRGIDAESIGWKQAAQGELNPASILRPESDDGVELRNLIAHVGGAWDLRSLGELPIPNQVGAVAFSRDGGRLAIAELLDNNELKVVIYDPATQRKVKEYVADVRKERSENLLRGLTRETPAFKVAAFSPDGRWLAVGTRSGWIYCWDTRSDQIEPIDSWRDSSGEISQFAYSSDSAVLYASTRTAGPVQARELQSRRSQLLSAVGRFVAASPTGSYLALGGEKLAVHSLEKQATINSWNSKCYSVAYSASGRWLAAGADSEVHLIDTTTGEIVKQLRDPFAPEESLDECLCFAADDQLLITSCGDEQVRIWDVDANKLLMRIPSPGKSHPLAAIDQAGKFLVVVGTTRAMLYAVDRPSHWQLIAQESDECKAIAFLNHSHVLATIHEQCIDARMRMSKLAIWDTDSGSILRDTKIVGPLDSHDEWYRPLTCQIAVHPADNDIVWAFSSGSLRWRRHERAPHSAFILDLGTVGGNTVEETDMLVIAPSPHSEIRSDLSALNGMAMQIAAGGGVQIPIDLEELPQPANAAACFIVAKTEGKPQNGLIGTYRLAIDGLQTANRPIECCGSMSDAYHLFQVGYWDMPTNICRQSASVTITVNESTDLKSLWIDRLVTVPIARAGPTPRLTDQGPFAYSTQGTNVWGIQNEKVLCRWRIDDFQNANYKSQPLSNEVHGDDILRAVLCVDDSVVVCARRGDLFLYNAETGQVRPTVSKHDSPIRTAAIDPRGEIVAVGTDSGQIWVVNIRDGRVVTKFAAHSQSIRALDFSDDGTLLVSGSQDRSIRLWRRSREGLVELFRYDNLPLPVRALSLSPDKSQMAVLLHRARGVRIWKLGELNATFQSLGVEVAELTTKETSVGNGR